MSTNLKVSDKRIRAFEAEHYEGMAELDRALYPDHASSVSEMRFSDEH